MLIDRLRSDVLLGLVAVCVAISGGFVHANNRPQTNDAASRSIAALDLAIAAAEAEIEDVSREAVRRAVGKGPPVSSVDLGGLLSPNQSRSGAVVYSSGYGNEPTTNGQAKVAERLVKVNELWVAKEFDPLESYRVFKEMVFPAERPSEAFPYSSLEGGNSSYSYSISLNNAEPEPVSCGAKLLVEWAGRANMTDDLLEMMEERGKMPGAQGTVELMRIVLANDNEEIDREELCRSLAQRPGLLVSDRDAPLLMSVTFALLKNMDRESEGRQALWDSILATTSTTERWATNLWLKHAIMQEAGDAVQRGDSDAFFRVADVALTVLAPLGTRNAEYAARMTSDFYSSAAERAFDHSQMQLGIECLKRQAASRTTSTGTSSLVKVASKLTKNLMKLTPEERHDALFDLVWDLPVLGLAQAAQVAPFDPIPQRYIQGYKNYRKTDVLPFQSLTEPSSRSISLLEWVIRDCQRLGKLDLVEQKIKELETKKSDDLPLAKLVLAKVQGEPMDLELVRGKSDEGQPLLRREVSGRGPLLPLDLEIAELAINDPTTREEGINLADRLAERGLQNRTNDVLFGRMLAGRGRLMTDNPPVSGSQLKHFVIADDFTGGDIQAGLPYQSLWLRADEGDWQHHAGMFRSSLLLKYPIVGSFEISFEASDETYGESAVTLGGVYMDFRAYVRDVALEAIGGRSAGNIENTGTKRSEFTKYSLKRDTNAGTLTLTCEGNEVLTMQVAAAEFPFYGLHSMMHRLMTTRDVKIAGDVTIPRELQLDNPNLVGWSSVFKGRRMQPWNYRGEEAKKTSGKKSDVAFEWRYRDGAIESVDHVALRSADREAGLKVPDEPKFPRREEWLYYLRPLCDGESLTFEFFQEKGKYSVHPTIDRQAIWFDEPKLRQHWITADGGTWFGVNSTNRIASAAKDVLGEVELKEGQWNQGAFRREGEQMILSINGKDIYTQTLDERLNGRFGFFHDPTKFQVKIRNVVLTGDWPEELPEDLFELDS